MPVLAQLDLVAEQRDERGHARRCLKLQTSGTSERGVVANVVVHNASISGVLIETSLPLLEDEALLVDLPLPGLVKARIVWRSGNLFGCRFDEEISPAALSALELRSDAPLSVDLGLRVEERGDAAASFGKQIEQLRKRRGLTLADVASNLGVSKPTVWAWEKGKSRPIDDRIPALAAVLRVDPSELNARSLAPGLTEAIADARNKIARACGIDAERVRIMIDL